jgi:predicted acyltransferase
VQRIEAWSRPFAVFGRNAILAYVGSGVLARIFTLVKVPSGAGAGVVSLQTWLYARVFEPFLPAPLASFGWALACVLLWLGILWRLDRRGLYLRL